MFCPRCHREFPGNYRFCPYDGETTRERPALSRVDVHPTQMTEAMLGDRYKIRGFIGRGGMARVYLAEDEKSGTPVAVKVLERRRASDPHIRERFLREAQAVNLIGHPNIVQVFEVGEREPDGAPYLVMEYLFGESVGSYLRRERVCPLEITLPALRQAASALAAAHKRGIIHRDVKPDNLYLIGEPGDPYELKVLDFGMSKLQTSDLTAAGIVLGTPGFMAPEQCLDEPLDARTDVYALGMVMYRMLTGRPPFRASDDIEVLAHQVWTVPPAPSRLVKLDGRVEAVILTAIRKQPTHRYPSMAVFFDDLGKLGDPRAKLWAGPVGEDRYRPQSKVAQLTAAAFGRAIGLEVAV
ncbi:MAG: serine/threonine protein kinase [Deltaproteobacteria bacterium]|nr:serine/threonine protein kinase [Deltaproteobacteria bacterium]MBW2530285.1 serine/threonine protein kinase [Deltaproteobacteria bacterium]